MIHVAYRPRGAAVDGDGGVRAVAHAHGTAAHMSIPDVPASDLARALLTSDFSRAVPLGRGVVHGGRTG